MRDYALAFGLTFAADIAWALWHKALARDHAGAAMLWSISIYLLGACVTVTIVANHWAILAACAGAAAGTYAAMRWKRGD